jgi:ubiquinone/menaquinone biosynthesis C-methylase UbiE
VEGVAKPPEEVVAKAEEAFEVIRPMRIISIEPPPPSVPAPAPPAPSAPPPAEAADGAAAPQPGSKPPKPPVVEEVEALEEVDEPATVASPAPIEAEAEAPRAARTDEIDPIPIDEDEERISDEGTDRISEADIAVHAEPPAVEVTIDEAPKPKKPPPPPPKRPVSTESAVTMGETPKPPAQPAVVPDDARPAGAPPAKPPPPPTAPSAASAPSAAAQATAPVITTAPASSPAPASVQTLDLSGKRRQKPWWEEIFSDDFIRTMEKVEPKVIAKECDFIEDRLGLEKGAVMLDLCCGAGLHAVELASRGYNVVGYDLSLAMLARAQDEAQDRGQKINFLQGDMREMAFEEAFDGMYSWSTSFGYFDDEKNLNVLSRVYRGLRQGGLFLLDVINRDYVCPRQPSLVWFEGDGCVCMDEMHVDFFTSRLRVKRTVMFEDGRSRECDYAIRLYGLHELGKMLHDTGFKVVEVTGHPAHPGVFFGSESPRVIILAERG